MESLHFAALFRDVEGLPCPTLIDEFPETDTRLMTAETASSYFRLPAAQLERFWVATHYPKLGLEAPALKLSVRGEPVSRDAYRVLRSAGYQQLTEPVLVNHASNLRTFCPREPVGRYTRFHCRSHDPGRLPQTVSIFG